MNSEAVKCIIVEARKFVSSIPVIFTCGYSTIFYAVTVSDENSHFSIKYVVIHILHFLFHSVLLSSIHV